MTLIVEEIVEIGIMTNEIIEEVKFDEDDESSGISFKPTTINTTTITTPPPIPAVINFGAPQIPEIQSAGAIMASPPIEKKERLTSVERLMEGENLKNVIKTIFQNAEVMTCEVKKGAKSSSNIYVHKRYTGKRATVIIWND
jgi:hypothetical protein